MTNPTKLERRLRIAGVMVLAALVIEEVSLRWSHPTAFLLFAIVAGALLGAGILLYLYSILWAT